MLQVVQNKVNQRILNKMANTLYYIALKTKKNQWVVSKINHVKYCGSMETRYEAILLVWPPYLAAAYSNACLLFVLMGHY